MNGEKLERTKKPSHAISKNVEGYREKDCFLLIFNKLSIYIKIGAIGQKKDSRVGASRYFRKVRPRCFHDYRTICKTQPIFTNSFADSLHLLISMNILPKPPDYATFLAEYLIPNRPCMVHGGLIDDWQACQEWTRVEDKIRRPDLNKLKHLYGNLMVTVIEFEAGDILSTSEAHSSTRRSLNMKFGEAVERWEAYLSTESEFKGHRATKLYVKDWHLPRVAESLDGQPCSFYTTPDIFRDDWMNQFVITSFDMRRTACALS